MFSVDDALPSPADAGASNPFVDYALPGWLSEGRPPVQECGLLPEVWPPLICVLPPPVEPSVPEGPLAGELDPLAGGPDGSDPLIQDGSSGLGDSGLGSLDPVSELPTDFGIATTMALGEETGDILIGSCWELPPDLIPKTIDPSTFTTDGLGEEGETSFEFEQNCWGVKPVDGFDPAMADWADGTDSGEISETLPPVEGVESWDPGVDPLDSVDWPGSDLESSIDLGTDFPYPDEFGSETFTQDMEPILIYCSMTMVIFPIHYYDFQYLDTFFTDSVSFDDPLLVGEVGDGFDSAASDEGEWSSDSDSFWEPLDGEFMLDPMCTTMAIGEEGEDGFYQPWQTIDWFESLPSDFPFTAPPETLEEEPWDASTEWFDPSLSGQDPNDFNISFPGDLEPVDEITDPLIGLDPTLEEADSGQVETDFDGGPWVDDPQEFQVSTKEDQTDVDYPLIGRGWDAYGEIKPWYRTLVSAPVLMNVSNMTTSAVDPQSNDPSPITDTQPVVESLAVPGDLDEDLSVSIFGVPLKATTGSGAESSPADTVTEVPLVSIAPAAGPTPTVAETQPLDASVLFLLDSTGISPHPPEPFDLPLVAAKD